MLAAAGAGGALVGAPSGAQDAPGTAIEVISRDGSAGGPWSDPDTASESPSISDDGLVVVFSATRAGLSTVGVRDRIAGTTTAVVGAVSRSGAVSGDGCVVAYVAALTDAPPWQPTIVDRCDGVTYEPVDTFPAAPAPPALSSDGAVVVWSAGTDLVVHALAGDSYAAAPGPTGLPPDAELGPYVDVSADGSVVVFGASSGGTSQVYVWNRSTPDPAQLVSTDIGDDPANGDSTRPTVSGDGSLIVFETTATDLAGDATTPAVVARDADGVVRLVAADASDPDVASGGRDVVFERDGAVRVATSGAGAPFETVTESLVALAADPDGEPPLRPDPVVSADGSRVAFASDAGATFTADTRFATGTNVWLRDRAAFQVSAVDVGDVPVGTAVDGTATVTNTGATGVALGVPTVDAPFAVVASTCGGVLLPGLSCDVTVRFTPAVVAAAAGTLTIADAVDATRRATAEVRGRGIEAATTTTVGGGSTTTTSSATTTTAPRITPTTRPRPPATTPRRPVTTIPRTRPTTVTVAGSPVLSFSPALVVLDSVVAGTGRATSVASLTNVGTAPATVLDVALDPSSAPGFVVDAGTCVRAVLAPGDACQVAVEFTSADVGSFAGVLVATADDGATATVELSATAVEPPSLTIGPDVATPGQVVTVTGAGFPVGEPLTVWWGRDAVAVTTDAAGTFRVPLVVMRHTAGGPFAVRVDEAPERYPETSASLLVRPVQDRPRSSAVRPNVGSLIGG